MDVLLMWAVAVVAFAAGLLAGCWWAERWPGGVIVTITSPPLTPKQAEAMAFKLSMIALEYEKGEHKRTRQFRIHK